MNYEVTIPGRRQEKTYHLHLLKKWNLVPIDPVTNLLAIVGEEDSEPIDLDGDPGAHCFASQIQTSQLAPEKRQQLLELVEEFQPYPRPSGAHHQSHNADSLSREPIGEVEMKVSLPPS